MNREISDYYRTVLLKRNLSEKEAREALYAAIRNGDTELIKACKGRLSPDEHEWDADGGEIYPVDFALKEMAHISTIEALIDIGFSLPDRPAITPFSGTSEEIAALLMKARKLDRKEAVKEHIFSTAAYLDVFSKGYSYYRIPFKLNPRDIFEPGFYGYLNAWLMDFAAFCEEEKEQNDDDPFYNLRTIIRVCSEEEELLDALKVFIDKGIASQHDIGWLMSHAIWNDNEKAFDLLLSIVSQDNIAEINMYPRKDMNLLKRLFSMNVLLPGTDEGFEALNHLLACRDDDEGWDEDILKAVMHPSYTRRKSCWGDGDEEFLPCTIATVRNFPVQYYPILAPTPDDLNARDKHGRTMLYYYAGRYPYCVEDMLNAGADPYDVDEDGNTVLHIMIAEGTYDVTINDVKEAIKFLHEDIIYKKNKTGKTPFDLFLEP